MDEVVRIRAKIYSQYKKEWLIRIYKERNLNSEGLKEDLCLRIAGYDSEKATKDWKIISGG